MKTDLGVRSYQRILEETGRAITRDQIQDFRARGERMGGVATELIIVTGAGLWGEVEVEVGVVSICTVVDAKVATRVDISTSRHAAKHGDLKGAGVPLEDSSQQEEKVLNR